MAETANDSYTFALVLGGFSESSAAIEDALFEAGCDDALLTFRGPTPVLEFDRKATSLEEALVTAIEDVEAAGIDASVLRAEPDDLVTASEIARRANISREAVRLWTQQQRGDGSFPPPLTRCHKSLLWSWLEVATWLANRDRLDPTVTAAARCLAAINVVLTQQRMMGIQTHVERIDTRLKKGEMFRRSRNLTRKRSQSSP